MVPRHLTRRIQHTFRSLRLSVRANVPTSISYLSFRPALQSNYYLPLSQDENENESVQASTEHNCISSSIFIVLAPLHLPDFLTREGKGVVLREYEPKCWLWLASSGMAARDGVRSLFPAQSKVQIDLYVSVFFARLPRETNVAVQAKLFDTTI